VTNESKPFYDDDNIKQRDITVIKADPGWSVRIPAYDDKKAHVVVGTIYEAVLAWRVETQVAITTDVKLREHERIDSNINPVALVSEDAFMDELGFMLRDPSGRIFRPECSEYKDEAEWVAERREMTGKEELAAGAKS
jgi:hypothetical protein